MLPTWLRWTIWSATLCYWLGLFVITHLPAEKLPYVPVTDKTAHLISYAALAGALFASFRVAGKRSPAVIVLAICLVYGVADELLQIPVNRSCERADWYADAAGASSAVVVASALDAWQQRRRQRVAIP